MTVEATAKTTRVPRRRRNGCDPAHPVYEVDLWLVDSEPYIWRTLAVPAEMSLDLFHVVIQRVMEWEDYHLHHFETRKGRRFEPKSPVGGVDVMWKRLGDIETASEVGFTLRNIFDELQEKLAYLYDFGDNWVHGIKLINTHEDASAFAQMPVCLAGEHAAPPEDCGGVWGYSEKLEILRNSNPKDPWHDEILEWMGEDFDPERFDLDELNRRLTGLWPRRRSRSSSSSDRRPAAKRRKRKSR